MRGLFVLAITVSGCIPLPAAFPPAKASIGIAAAFGNPLPDLDGTALSDVEGMVIGRVGVVPQSMWPEQHRRPVEVEAGYTFHIFTSENWQRRNRHGGFLGVSVLAGDFWLGENWRARVVLRGAAEVYALQELSGDGGGGSWGIGFEIAQFMALEGENGDPIRYYGWMSGEWSVGVELTGGAFSIAGADYGYVAFAITGRWPGAFGLGLIPLSGSF